MSERYTKKQYLIIVIAFILCVVPRFMDFPPVAAEGVNVLTKPGAIVLFSTAAAVLLFIFVSTGWPTILLLVSLAAIPELGMAKVVQGSIGNLTGWYLLLCFMLAASLVNTGVAKRLAVWIMTCRFSRKGPWYTIAMIFAANFLISSILSSTATIMIFLPIAYEILEELDYKKGDGEKLPVLILMGVVVIGQIAQATSPISHVHTALGIATYSTFMGEELGFFQYVSVALPVGLAATVIWFLVYKYIFRPDVSRLKNFDHDVLRGKLPPMSKREKAAGFVYALVVIFWTLPGVSKYISPALYSAVGGIQQCFPPMVALIVLHLWRVDGEPVLPFSDALKAAPVGTFLFIAALLVLGDCFNDPNVALSSWLSGILESICGGVSPLVFLLIVTLFCGVATNFIANALAVSVTLAIALPLCATLFAGQINPVFVCIMITMVANFAYATPCATPPCAVALETGWLNSRQLFGYGMAALFFSGLAAFVIGVPLGSLIL